MNYTGLKNRPVGMVSSTLVIGNLTFTNCLVQLKCLAVCMTNCSHVYGTSVTKLKIKDKLLVLERMGEVETYEVKSVNGDSFIIADLSSRNSHFILGMSDVFSQAEGRTEASALHKLYKVTARRLLNECYRIDSVNKSL